MYMRFLFHIVIRSEERVGSLDQASYFIKLDFIAIIILNESIPEAIEQHHVDISKTVIFFYDSFLDNVEVCLNSRRSRHECYVNSCLSFFVDREADPR